MTPVWDDVIARSHGLSTHLLDLSQLEGLARQPDLAGLTAALRSRGMAIGVTSEMPAPEAVELGVRRWAAAAMRTLARWTGSRRDALPLVFDEEDRRSLRAILRGAMQHAPAARRLGGLIPTPSLPELALEELAAAATIPAAVSLLVAWCHPFATELADATASVQPDALAIDLALSRALARRAVEAAARSHDRGVRRFVRETIDIENGVTAVVTSAAKRDIAARELHLAGGAKVTLDIFEAAVNEATPAMAGVRIAAALAETPYAAPFRDAAGDPATMEDELFRRRLQHLVDRVRRAPLTALTPILFVYRLRAQVFDLQRIIWTVALNGPRRWLVDSWLTAA